MAIQHYIGKTNSGWNLRYAKIRLIFPRKRNTRRVIQGPKPHANHVAKWSDELDRYAVRSNVRENAEGSEEMRRGVGEIE